MEEEKYWSFVQEEILELLKEGRTSQALEVQRALDESKDKGKTTIKLALLMSDIVQQRARAVIERRNLNEINNQFQYLLGNKPAS